MRKSPQHYNDEERLLILRNYYSSGMGKTAFCRKYNLCGSSQLNAWIRRFESHPDLVSLFSKTSNEDMANRDKESYKQENAELKKRIKELEKALAFSKLETEARDLLIDKAEAHFNIPIRKKSGAKQ